MDFKKIWGGAAVVALISTVIVAIGIVAIGSLLLLLAGTPAVIAGVLIMALITAVAYFLAREPEGKTE